MALTEASSLVWGGGTVNADAGWKICSKEGLGDRKHEVVQNNWFRKRTSPYVVLPSRMLAFHIWIELASWNCYVFTLLTLSDLTTGLYGTDTLGYFLRTS